LTPRHRKDRDAEQEHLSSLTMPATRVEIVRRRHLAERDARERGYTDV